MVNLGHRQWGDKDTLQTSSKRPVDPTISLCSTKEKGPSIHQKKKKKKVEKAENVETVIRDFS